MGLVWGCVAWVSRRSGFRPRQVSGEVRNPQRHGRERRHHVGVARLPPLLAAGPIELRRWRPGDIDNLLVAVASSLTELSVWMPWAQELPSREAELNVLLAFDESFEAGSDFGDGMDEPPSGSVVGGCGLHLRHGPNIAEVGYWVRTDRHRRGYATAAARALTDAAFSYLPGVDRVDIAMDVANVASARVARKLGFSLSAPESRAINAPGHTGRGLRWVLQRGEWRSGGARGG